MKLDFEDMQAAVSVARKQARKRPGPNGGAYVGRKYNTLAKCNLLIVLADNPDNVPEDVDLLAHVTTEAVTGLGRLRGRITQDGSIVEQAS